jgi:hypothetical protein
LLVIGVGVVSYSLHEVLGAHEENPLSWTMLQSIPVRIFFLALPAIGGALLLLGVPEIMSSEKLISAGKDAQEHRLLRDDGAGHFRGVDLTAALADSS